MLASNKIHELKLRIQNTKYEKWYSVKIETNLIVLTSNVLHEGINLCFTFILTLLTQLFFGAIEFSFK